MRRKLANNCLEGEVCKLRDSSKPLPFSMLTSVRPMEEAHGFFFPSSFVFSSFLEPV